MAEGYKHYTESLHYELEQTAYMCKALGMQTFEKLNISISPEEFKILDTLVCKSGMCQRDLAKLILRDRANTGRLLNALEKSELIVRTVDTKNNRLVKKIEISDKGRILWQDIINQVRPLVDVCIQKIPREDVRALQSALKKFRASLETIVDLQI